jgi:hypothetical protein
MQKEAPLKDGAILLKQNKPEGFMYGSCSWSKPADPHSLNFVKAE